MTFMNNVSHENGNKTTASIQFFNLFPFYTKIKTSILLHSPPVRQIGYNKCSYLTYYEKYKTLPTKIKKLPETGKRNGDLFLISILSVYFNKFLCLVTAQPIPYLRPYKSK